MKLKETILVSEWQDGSGWVYEDFVVDVKECDFPHLSSYDPEEFDWNDYADYFSVELLEGFDLLLTVRFFSDGIVVYSNSEWVSVLKEEENGNEDY